jgi:hypothetical protein
MHIPYLDQTAPGNEGGDGSDVRRFEGRWRQLGCRGMSPDLTILEVSAGGTARVAVARPQVQSATIISNRVPATLTPRSTKATMPTK